MPTGVTSSGRNPSGSNSKLSTTSWLATSMMLTEPDSSLVTHSSLPSGVSAKRRGRLPTRMLASTSSVAVFTACTMFATSEVT